jgi:hypothetical protein
MLQTIKESILRELVGANSVKSVCAVGRFGSFAVIVRYGSTEKILTNTRGDTRLFASLNTAADFLRRLGVERFEVDVTNFSPGRLRKPRPDRAEALRKTRTKPRQKHLI